MTNTRCYVANCKVTSRKLRSKKEKNTTKFHQFPKNEAICLKWIEACNRPDLLQVLAQNMRRMSWRHVCSRHFHPFMYKNGKLGRNAFPTENLPPTSKQANRPEQEIEVADKDIEDGTPTNPEPVKDLEMSEIELLQQSLDASISQALERKKRRIQRNASIAKLKKQRTKIDPHISKILVQPKTDPSDITLEQFLKACDKFLSPNLSKLVKSSILQSSHAYNTSKPSGSESPKDSDKSNQIKIVAKKIYISSEMPSDKERVLVSLRKTYPSPIIPPPLSK